MGPSVKRSSRAGLDDEGEGGPTSRRGCPEEETGESVAPATGAGEQGRRSGGPAPHATSRQARVRCDDINAPGSAQHLGLALLASVKLGTIQRRLAWPLRKDDTHISRGYHFLRFLGRLAAS